VNLEQCECKCSVLKYFCDYDKLNYDTDLVLASKTIGQRREGTTNISELTGLMSTISACNSQGQLEHNSSTFSNFLSYTNTEKLHPRSVVKSLNCECKDENLPIQFYMQTRW